MKNIGERYNNLRRPRCAVDVALFVGALLSVLAVLGGAGLAAWSLATENDAHASTVTSQNLPQPY